MDLLIFFFLPSLSPTKRCTGNRYVFLSAVFYTACMRTFFFFFFALFLLERCECLSVKPIPRSVRHYTFGGRNQDYPFTRNAHNHRWLWELLVRATSLQLGYASLLCSVTPYRTDIQYYSPKRPLPLPFFWPTPRACGIRHCLSCSRSNLTCIPMILSVLSPSSPVCLSILTHQSIITRPISPLIVQTMQAGLLNLISPFYLLFTKNSLAGPCNYVVITAAEEKISQISFSLHQCGWTPTIPPHAGDICVWVFFNRQLSARLVLSEPLPCTSLSWDFRITSASPALKKKSAVSLSGSAC